MHAAGLPALSPAGHRMPQKAQFKRRTWQGTRNLWNTHQLSPLRSQQLTTWVISRLDSTPTPRGVSVPSTAWILTPSPTHILQLPGLLPRVKQLQSLLPPSSKVRARSQLKSTKDCAEVSFGILLAVTAGQAWKQTSTAAGTKTKSIQELHWSHCSAQ